MAVRRSVFAVGLLVLAGCAQAPTPKVHRVGNAVESAAYSLGDAAFRIKGVPGPVELTGVVHHPRNPAGRRLPMVAMLHGAWNSCYKAGETAPGWPCKKGYRAIPSHRGFDHLGRALAARGFVVVSISANGINQADRLDPAGMTGRGLLVQKHLELWRAWATKGGKPFGQRFRNAIDFTRIGTMGHSRGGEGVLRHFQINAERGRPFGVRAVMPLASTNHHRPVVTGVPLAVVLPQCDGDLSDQPGVHYYDEGRYRSAAPRYAAMVKGANHDFFNSVWSPGGGFPGGQDDAAHEPASSVCHPKSATRLTQAQQRQIGADLVAGFFGHHLKGEPWRPDPRLVMSAMNPRRRDINRVSTPRDLRTNALGGNVALTGAPAVLCGGPGQRPSCLRADRADTYEPHRWNGTKPGLPLLRVAWKAPATWTNHIPQGRGDVSGFRTLAFRAAVDPTDPLNPPGRPQKITVTLTDAKGRQATAAASGPALDYPVPTGHGSTNFLLHQLRVPLGAFPGVDLRDVRSVALGFTGEGAIGLTDLAFSA